jgi:hypothetical protein
MSPQSIEQGVVAGNIEIQAPSRGGTWLRSIFGRHVMDMAVLMMLAVIFSALHTPGHILVDPDIWWHLADARILTTTHHFIRVEPYSFTVAGERWVNPEWLSELPYWFGYRILGLRGIYLMTLIVLSANVFFLYWRSRYKAQNTGIALWMAGFGLFFMCVNASARTILLAYLALSAEMAILEAVERGRARLLWLLPPLFCVWINLHGSWIIGLALVVLYTACGLFRANAGVFEQQPFSGSERNRLIAVLVASVAAMFVNPYGWRLVWNPFDMMLNQKLNIANVSEWQPLSLGTFVGKAAVVAIGLTLVTNGLRSRKWKIYEFALIFFAWYAAFNHARFTFLASVLTIPMLGADVVRCFFSKNEAHEQKTIPLMNALVAALALGVIAWYFPAKGQMEKDLAEDFPLQTIDSIQATWRTLNTDGTGGMMDFAGKPTFIDTRWDTFEHHGVMKDFIDIVRLHDSLELLGKYGVDHILLRHEDPLAYLLERTPEWTVIRTEGKEENQYELFARTPKASSAGCLPTAQGHP